MRKISKKELKRILEEETPTEHPLFNKAINQFEKQYQCELDPTGYEFLYSDNDGVGEIEYWCNGLINSPVRDLDIKIGGWISHDTRDNEDNIYLLFALQINGQNIGDCEGLQCWYDVESNRWDNLTWDTY